MTQTFAKQVVLAREKKVTFPEQINSEMLSELTEQNKVLPASKNARAPRKTS
jgi:hypothetical protein